MSTNYLEIEVLEAYLDGKLDSKAMHFVEKQALEDPFVAEALEGLSLSPRRMHHLSILQKRLQDRIDEKPLKLKAWNTNTQRLSIAATATVAFLTISIYFILKENDRRFANENNAAAKNVIINLDTLSVASAPNADLSLSKSPVSIVYNNIENGPTVHEDFSIYVSNNNRLTKNGYKGNSVLLTFKVNTDGSATELNIKKSGTTEENLEAIRLIQQGPKWKINDQSIRDVEMQILF